MAYLEDSDSPDGTCLVGELVEIRDDGLLVGDGDVEAAQVGMLGDELRKVSCKNAEG